MKIVVAGGTGLIGRALLRELEKREHKIVVLTRNIYAVKYLESDFVKLLKWDARTLDSWMKCFEWADAVINLVGEPLAEKRWTLEQKEKIAGSRVEATKAIVGAIEKAKEKPTVLINASAVGYYGHIETGDIIESFPKGKGFLSDTCYRWEKIANEATNFGTRVVLLRTGMVLAKRGSALKKMILPFMFYIGGVLGSGKQWVSWIHRDDVVKIILFALENKNISGPLNVTAPEPVLMKDFCKLLGKVLERSCWVPVPEFALKMLMGEMAEIVLTGQKAVPKKLLDAGYHFQYSTIEEALEAVFNKITVF